MAQAAPTSLSTNKPAPIIGESPKPTLELFGSDSVTFTPASTASKEEPPFDKISQEA